jgi:hypothetical protein
MSTLRVSKFQPVRFKTVQFFRVKKLSRLLLGAALVFSFSIGIESCRKINEATELGGGLIPPVDNINTFADTLDVLADNQVWSDSTQVFSNDELALGYVQDPEFGDSRANIYYSFGPQVFNAYPFGNRDSLLVSSGLRYDSVVLSLGVTSIQGDSFSTQRVRVFEIDPNSRFTDSVYFTNNTPEFDVAGGELGTADYVPARLRDSVRIDRVGDTTYATNTLRIKLNQGSPFIERLINGDSLTTYRNFGIFYSQFRGLAIRSEQMGNAFTYFNMVDSSRTKLTVYYKIKRNGVYVSTSYSFYHGLLPAVSKAPAEPFAPVAVRPILSAAA